ncbi:hypothetical protein Poli38472_012608 [Pythium oligandrum]|uniref:FYVE-type domain-containing protein n=1 Tax=Pythium oligandrum TaxID=41045 RepID=A0A8K1CDR8_PYTOL|nr:hypothetical protein Poli38472_012608 [Pythium oligandrum]|eukprot:TMW61417.1 hypothetical protein Poli38472_012608 [Pythium oligandrum]
MKSSLRLPPNALPQLNLSPAEERWVMDEATAVIAETLQREQRFMARGRILPKSGWRVIKSKDDFSVFKERSVMRMFNSTPPPSGAVLLPSERSASAAGAFFVDEIPDDPSIRLSRDHGSMTATRGMWMYTGRGDNEGIIANMKDHNIPMIKGTGYIEGTINDVLYGSLAADDYSWRFRTFYMKDKLADARILATIRRPTSDRAFEFLGIKWFTKESPRYVGSFVQPRDFIVLEANGTGVDDTGTPFGYHIVHSIRLRGVADLSEIGVTRAKMSLCFIIRQASDNKVHIFGRGFSDPRGDMLESVSVGMTADSMAAPANAVECSYAKKLMWMMRHQRRHVNKQTQTSITLVQCDSCDRSQTKLVTCQVCARVICSRCTVQRKVLVDITMEGVITERSLAFCFGCVVESKKITPGRVARDSYSNNFYPAEISPNESALHVTTPTDRLSYTTSPPAPTSRPPSVSGHNVSVCKKAKSSPPPAPGIVLY